MYVLVAFAFVIHEHKPLSDKFTPMQMFPLMGALEPFALYTSELKLLFKVAYSIQG